MEQVRQILKKMVYPKTVFVVLLAILSGAALAFVFVKGYEHSIFAYTVYAVSAYSLTIVVMRLVIISKAGRDKLHSNALYHKYSTDLDFKAVVSIHLSLAITLIFYVTKAAAGIYYRSAWFGSMAFYYIVLALATAFVSLFFLQTSMFAIFGDGDEWQRYMNIGTGSFVFLLIMGIAVFMIITGKKAISKLE